MTRRIWGALVLAVCSAAPVQAQDQNQDQDQDQIVPTVQVSGVRDPAMMPYADAYKSLSKVRDIGGGKMALEIRILSAQTMRPMPDLEIALQGDTRYEKLALSADGFLTVPLSQERVDDKAVFVTNKKKGSVRTAIFFVPTLPAGQLRYADILASITAAKRVRSALIPWYGRIMVPAIEIVNLCYPDNRQVITISNRSTVMRAADVRKKSLQTEETVYCASFTRAEADAEPDSVLTLAPGYTASFN